MEESLYSIHAEMEDEHWWFVARRKIISAVAIKLADNVSKSFVIDVGCGTGGSIAHFMEVGFRCLGIDASQSAIDYAVKKFPAGRFRCGTMPDDLEDVSADTTLFTLLDVLASLILMGMRLASGMSSPAGGSRNRCLRCGNSSTAKKFIPTRIKFRIQSRSSTGFSMRSTERLSRL